MTWTVVAQLISPDGANVRRYVSLDPRHMWKPVRHKSWVVNPAEVRSTQAAEIPLRPGHGFPPFGRLTWLERRSDGSLWCVGEVDEDIHPSPTQDLYLSVEAEWDEHTGADVVVRGAALVERTLMIGLQPATLLRNGLDPSGRAAWRLGSWTQHLLEQASHGRRGGPIVVHEERKSPGVYELDRQPTGTIEFRSATHVEVSGRVVEIIVMPWERPAIVEHRGRMVSEVVARGAFDEIERQTRPVRVNRDHSWDKTVGRAVAFHPHRPEGLVAELRIARTPLGEETLTLAAEGCLDASAGFKVLPGGEQWPTSSERRLTRLHLDHVAMVASPAYEDAKVLAVRGV